MGSWEKRGRGGRKEETHVQEVDLLEELLLMEFQFTHLEFCGGRDRLSSDLYRYVRARDSTNDLNEVEVVEGWIELDSLKFPQPKKLLSPTSSSPSQILGPTSPSFLQLQQTPIPPFFHLPLLVSSKMPSRSTNLNAASNNVSTKKSKPDKRKRAADAAAAEAAAPKKVKVVVDEQTTKAVATGEGEVAVEGGEEEVDGVVSKKEKKEVVPAKPTKVNGEFLPSKEDIEGDKEISEGARLGK